MKRFVLLAGLVGLLGMGCSGSDDNGEASPDIYPLSVGNWWRFSAVNSQDTSWFVDSVISYEDFGSYGNAFSIKEVNESGYNFNWHAQYSDGYLVFLLAGSTDTTELKIMERYPKVGDSWASGVLTLIYDRDGDNIDDTVCTIQYVDVVSQEDLSTPAGDFQGVYKSLTSSKDSVWYSSDSTWHVDSAAENDTYYYWAAGIGLVKYHPYETDTTGYHLDSYSVK